jgi:putative membrane protein
MFSAMKNTITGASTVVPMSLCFFLAAVFAAAAARAADPPSTAEVLGKVHHSDQKEIEMGKLAEKNGQAKAVKDFGKALVKDHTAADKKATTLAKQEKIDINAAAPAMKDGDMATMAPGPDFDDKFAKAMVEDHKKDIAAVTAARDATTDDKLKKLLTDLLPTLQKHEEMAQKIVDNSGKQ